MGPKERLWHAVPIPGSHAADRKYSRLPKKTPTKRSCDDNLSCFWMVGYSGVGSHPLRMTPTLSPTVYPSTSSAVAPGRKSRSVDFASNRDRRIGYCQQSRRALSRLLAASLSFPSVINGCVCHLHGQPTINPPLHGYGRLSSTMETSRRGR